MKWINEPIEPSEPMLLLSANDLEVLQPAFKYALSVYRSMCAGYEEGRKKGCLTDQQNNKLEHLSRIVGKLECLVNMTVI